MPANPDRDGGSPGADAKAFVIAEVLRLRVLRKTAKTIADEITAAGYPIGWCEVQRIVRNEAIEVRRRNAALCDERYAEQDATLEYAIGKVIANLEKCDWLDDKLLRALCVLLDRQAKLHGIDRAKQGGGASKHDWLEGKSHAELMAEAERLGVRVPRPFKTTIDN